MNDLYKKRHGIPVDDTNKSTAMRAVNKLIERERESRERSKDILSYYQNGQQKKRCESAGGRNNGI